MFRPYIPTGKKKTRSNFCFSKSYDERKKTAYAVFFNATKCTVFLVAALRVQHFNHSAKRFFGSTVTDQFV